MPLALPPPGVSANFESPDSNSYHVNIAVAICIPIIVIFASLRIYNQLRIQDSDRPGKKLSDYTFMLASVWTIIYFGLVLGLLDKGLFGTHIWDLRLENLTNTPFLLVLLLEGVYGPFVWLIKVSLFLMYRQFFSAKVYVINLCRAGIIVTGLFYWSSTVAKIALCAPRGKETYIMAFATARCGRTKTLAIWNGVFNILSDLYLLTIPIYPSWTIQNTVRVRLGLLAIFSTGILAFNASALGLHYRVQVNKSLDDTWKIMPLYLAISIIEMTAGIVVLCMPATAGIIKHYKHLYKTNNNSRSRIIEDVPGMYFRMPKLRTVDPTSNPRDLEAIGSKRQGHTATSSGDSAIQLRTHTSDSATLKEHPSVEIASPRM
ncbi:MAG: hypothetical protein Q9166_000335 [cf. Caloplaca sp. 2 TL-2023]